MTRHAKASPAGSTQRPGSRLGRFFRGAVALRAFLPGAKGTGAPSHGAADRNGARTGLATLAAFMVLFALPAVAQARIVHVYESAIREVPAEGPGGPVPAPGPLEEVNAMTIFAGDLFVADRLSGGGIAGFNSRVDQFAPSLPGEYEFVSQLPPQPEERGQNRSEGIAFGSAAGEMEMYLSQSPFYGRTGVDVFAAGLCESLECAAPQALWEGKEVPENGPFVGVSGVAVDHSTSPGDWASGDVFVADSGVANEVIHPPAIDIFEPQAGGGEKYVGQVTGPSPSERFFQNLNEPFNLSVAVSGFNGDLVVGDGRAVYLFRPEEEGVKKGKYVFERQLGLGAFEPQLRLPVAVDDSGSGTFAGEIYVATGTRVDEFGPEGVFRGDIAGASGALAVDPVSHLVFVGGDVFGPDLVEPDVVTEAPSNLVLESDPETGANSWRIEPVGSVNPLGEGEAACWFVWGLTKAFGNEAPCAAPVNGPSPVPVHATLTGLEPDTAYTYRLQAKNANGTNPGEPSEDLTFTTPGPGLHSESVSDVTSSGATFEATIAPHDAPVEEHDLQAVTSSPTSYFFQYSTQSTAVCAAEPTACLSVPSAPVSAASRAADVQVSQHASGLTPNTTFHYRLVAMNEALPATEPGVLIPFYGPDRTFTTQGPGGPLALPDGRAWELVSPTDKHGALILPSGQASVDGSGFTFRTSIPTEPEPPGAGEGGIQVLSSRTGAGQWSSVDINLSRSSPEGALASITHEYRYFSPDFGSSYVESEGPFSIPEGSHLNERGEWERMVEASPVPTERTPYLRRNSTCATEPTTCFEPLLDSQDVTSGKRVEGDPEANEGQAHFVGATPDAKHALISSTVQLTTEPATEGGLYEWSADKPPAERLSLVNVVPETGEPGPRLPVGGLSPDGSRILFGGGALYLHDVGSDETARLDLTESGSVPSFGTPSVAGASTDLSKVLFTDEAMLTEHSGLHGADLYVCELGPEGPGAPKCALTDLTPVPAVGLPGAGEDAQVSHALGVSHDGSYVYFLAKGVQAAGATPGEGKRENLYVAHEHEGAWTTSFIASAHVSLQAEGTEPVVSPDGRRLAFSSSTSLTGYDNRDAKTGSLDTEVYLYDVQTGKLVCASCDPSGARPLGPAVVPASPHGSEGALLAGTLVWQQEPGARSLFDTGRLFFNSGDALMPQDTNGNVDVYEFEPEGVGSCTAADPMFDPAAGGCVALISSGRASGESVFLEASANSSDVFFSTTERLVGKDTDTALDVYDAHECTSASPCAPPEPPQPPACLTADACRPAPQPQLSISGEPSSAAFFGPGNEHPKKHYKHHKKRHHKKAHKRHARANRRAGK